VCLALLHGAYPLLANISHNAEHGRTGASWAQYTAYAKSIRGSDLARLRRICGDRAKEASESFDDLFMAYDSNSDSMSEDKSGVPVAVGIFYFEDKGTGADQIWGNS
jgi:hypothetical protein